MLTSESINSMRSLPLSVMSAQWTRPILLIGFSAKTTCVRMTCALWTARMSSRSRLLLLRAGCECFD